MKHLFRELFSRLSFGIGETRSVYQEVPHNEPPPTEVTRKDPLGVDPKSTGKFLKTGPLPTSLGGAQGDGKKGERKVYKMETPFVVDVTDIQKKIAGERAALQEKAQSAMQKALAKMQKAMDMGQTTKELLANVPTDEQIAEAFQRIGGAPTPSEPEKPIVAEIPLPTPPPTVAQTDKPTG